MKPTQWAWLVVAACLPFAAAAARAQMGMNLFEKPNITDIFKPVVGNGAPYEKQRTDQQNAPKVPMEMSVITVPAGTFSCQHWKKDEGVGDVWVSDKVSPFGMIKSVSSGETMVLTKVITDAKDHITGPGQQFDPQAMRQQMMEKMQKQTPKP
jgi:hypothetical protein